jgi:hypothetical protein
VTTTKLVTVRGTITTGKTVTVSSFEGLKDGTITQASSKYLAVDIALTCFLDVQHDH